MNRNVVLKSSNGKAEVIAVNSKKDIRKMLNCNKLRINMMEHFFVFSDRDAKKNGNESNFTLEYDIGDRHIKKEIFGNAIIAGIIEYFDDFTGLDNNEIEYVMLAAC